LTSSPGVQADYQMSALWSVVAAFARFVLHVATGSRYVDKLPFLRTLIGCMIMALLLGGGRVAGLSAPLGVLAEDMALSNAAPGTVLLPGSGYHHGLAVMGDGAVAAWGATLFAQTGIPADAGDACENRPCVYTPVIVAGLPPISTVAGGGDHTLALAADGTVWAWGANYSGQLGAPVGDRCGGLYSTCTPVPTRVPGLTGVVAIAAGYEHSLALKGDGTVWAWGGMSMVRSGRPAMINAAIRASPPFVVRPRSRCRA